VAIATGCAAVLALYPPSGDAVDNWYFSQRMALQESGCSTLHLEAVYRRAQALVELIDAGGAVLTIIGMVVVTLWMIRVRQKKVQSLLEDQF
jgi:hypothetical protein